MENKKDCCGNCKEGKTCVNDIKADPEVARQIKEKQKAVSTEQIIKK